MAARFWRWILGLALALAVASGAFASRALSLPPLTVPAIALGVLLAIPVAFVTLSFLIAQMVADDVEAPGRARNVARALLSEICEFIVAVLAMSTAHPRRPAHPLPAAGGVRPVLLLHGILCNGRVWRALQSRLHAVGFGPVEALDVEPLLADLEIQTRRVALQLLALQNRCHGERVVIVAHSMGGLIARIATQQLAKRYVRKLIMLGTPNLGSFAPVQALRGTYPFVRKMSRLDRRHSPEYLAEKVFCTFPGLYHMLPPPQRGLRINLLDPSCWPSDGPVPDATLLRQAGAVRRRLAAPDARMTHIVGVNRETVVAARRTASGFEYGSSVNGDGTVPVTMAVLPRLRSYFIDELHGNLANNSRVIRAIIDLLRRGRTRELARRFVPSQGRLTRIDDARLRLVDAGKIDWRRLDSAQREAALTELEGDLPARPGMSSMA